MTLTFKVTKVNNQINMVANASVFTVNIILCYIINIILYYVLFKGNHHFKTFFFAIFY